MIRPYQPNENALSDYVQLLLQLHQLIAAGKSESEEAEEIRDQMDRPWQSLSPAEVALAEGLSEDLYSLAVDRLPVEEALDPYGIEEFRAAVESNDWAKALNVLRENKNSFDAAVLSYMRGACWAHLWQPHVAIVFFEEVARIKALSADEEIWLLTCLIQAGRVRDAVPRALEIANAESDPLLLLKAAEVLFVEAGSSVNEQSETRHQIAIEAAERGLGLARSLAEDETLDVMRLSTYLHLALSYDELGKIDPAREACEMALKLAPNNLDALLLLGYLHHVDYPKSDRLQFRQRFHQRLAESKDELSPVT